MKIETSIKRYTLYMEEVKSRLNVIERALEAYSRSSSLTGYRESDIELSFLQFRKCLELIMFSSLVAHHEAGIKLQRKLVEGEWNATKIMATIARANSNFYPIPKKPQSKKVNGVLEVSDLENGFLTRQEFGNLYDRVCGSMLHAQRTPQFAEKHHQYLTEIKEWHQKLVFLLNHHWVHVDDKNILAVLMQSDQNGNVQVARLEKLP